MEQSLTIRQVFEEECEHLVIDAKFVKKLKNYQLQFVNKNEEHIAFFGGNLLGVQVVRFTSDDRSRWFDDILEADETLLEQRLLALPTVNEDWVVSSDTMNNSCVWLLHAIYTSKHLNPQQKHDAMIDAALVLQYKYLTSCIYHYFRFPAARDTAEATYAQLSYKFSLKEYGSWSALLLARAEAIISKDKSIHFKVIEKMDDDLEVRYLLNDTQGRIRDTVKNIYAVFKQVHTQGTKILTTSTVVEHDGVEIFKDKSHSLMNYTRYLQSIVTDRNSFIRDELSNIIQKVMHTMPPRLFQETLEWMSANYRQTGANLVEEVLNETLLHSFDYLSHNRGYVKNERDLSGLITRLRGVYMSSRSTDPALLSLRSKMESIVKKATGNKNESVIASVRTGALLYIVARSFSMHHYTQK